MYASFDENSNGFIFTSLFELWPTKVMPKNMYQKSNMKHLRCENAAFQGPNAFCPWSWKSKAASFWWCIHSIIDQIKSSSRFITGPIFPFWYFRDTRLDFCLYIKAFMRFIWKWLNFKDTRNIIKKRGNSVMESGNTFSRWFGRKQIIIINIHFCQNLV